MPPRPAIPDTRPAAPTLPWALDHHEKIVDFAYRAVHETAVQAKAIIKAFYGEVPSAPISVPARMADGRRLMEAQRYPADYDGIIAGAPADYWTHLLTTAHLGSAGAHARP